MAATQPQISQLVVCYPGRFQPCGMHHATTFNLLKARFDAIGGHTFMVTSNKVELPKSPLNFKEKKRIINAHGIQEVVEVSNPYLAKEVLTNYDPVTTAVIYAVGHKDMSGPKPRFKPGFKKNGEPSYYQYYDGNEGKLVPYTKHGYLVTAPHVDIQIPGIGEMSGTALRNVLATADEENFASVMGFFDKPIHEMVKSKFASSGSKRKKKKTKHISRKKKTYKKSTGKKKLKRR